MIADHSQSPSTLLTVSCPRPKSLWGATPTRCTSQACHTDAWLEGLARTPNRYMTSHLEKHILCGLMWPVWEMFRSTSDQVLQVIDSPLIRPVQFSRVGFHMAWCSPWSGWISVLTSTKWRSCMQHGKDIMDSTANNTITTQSQHKLHSN